MQRLAYRPDIDGLRAVAVLCVLFFHAGFTSFGGGFIGVDVFFVISGFLITRLIKEEYETGTFSYAKFYLRRARRLLPALFFVYILCYIFAYLLFIPEHFARFGRSLLASLFSLANAYFWKGTDYFDTEVIVKPLLHTWSLSVEEQFYFFWPVSLVFLLKRKKSWLTPLAIVIVGLISMALNQCFLAYPAAIFYLIPFRVFEFCIGALMVWLVQAQPRNAMLLEPMLLLGVAMIVYPATTYVKDMAFPSVNALLPCLGTALIIYSGTATYSGKILSNRLMVFIGLISYSLYLTHWPMIVFYKYYRFDAISTYETWGVLACAFLLSTAMYYYIELPCRKGRIALQFSSRQFVSGCIAIALVIAYGGYYAHHKNGLPERAGFKSVSPQFEQARRYKSCDHGYGICDPDNERPQEHPHPDFAMIGDSHTDTMEYPFGAIAADHALVIEKHMISGCLGVYDNGLECAADMNKELDSIIERKIKNVLMVSNWNSLTHDNTADDVLMKQVQYTIRKLKTAGINVYVYGSIPFMQRDPATCFERPLFSSCEERMALPDYDAQATFNQQLKTVALENGAKYFDIFTLLCDGERCRAGFEGLSLYGDRIHLKKDNFGAYVFMTYGDPKHLSFDRLFTPSAPASAR